MTPALWPLLLPGPMNAEEWVARYQLSEEYVT